MNFKNIFYPLTLTYLFIFSPVNGDTLTMVKPTVKIDESGNITAVWINTLDERTTIQTASKPWSKNWSAATTIFDSPTNIYDFDMIMNRAGSIVLTWTVLDRETSTYVLYSACQPTGEAWSSPVIVSDPLKSVENIYSIDMNASGEITIVWNIYNDNSELVSYSSDGSIGGNWSPPTPLTIHL